jgi:Arc/MetJ-type ribon-helix-helix transcriptional regulator
MTITLRPEYERMIAQAIQSGAYQSPDQVVERALEALSGQSDKTNLPPVTRSQLAGKRIRELRRGVTLGGIPIKELIEEGRE